MTTLHSVFQRRGRERRAALAKAEVSLEQVVRLAELYCERHFDRAPTRSFETQPLSAKLARNYVAGGWDGTPFRNGLRWRERQTAEFDEPWIARGIRTDFGRLEQLARTSPQWSRVLEVTDQLLLNAQLLTQQHPEASKRYPALAPLIEACCDTVTRSNAQMRGGLLGLMRESCYSLLTAGFSVHVLVDRLDGLLDRAAFRRSNTVARWLLDADERELLGVEFTDANGGYYAEPMEHLLIASWRPVGNDLEGVPPLRTAAPFIVAKQMILQLWFARFKKYAVPVIAIESGEVSDTKDDERLVSLWDAFEADDYPVLTLKRGQKVVPIDLGGTPSDFESALRYCDEQILMPLSSEGALLGLNNRGAFNLGEIKDQGEIGQALSVVQRVLNAFNGVDNVPWQGVTTRIAANAYGLRELVEYPPQVAVSLGEDETPIADVVSAAAAGLVVVTPEIQEWVARRMKLPVAPAALPQRTLAPGGEVAAGLPGAADVQESALNGAQTASLLQIIAEVKSGAIDLNNGVQAAMLAFQISEERARALVTPGAPAPATAPQETP